MHVAPLLKPFLDQHPKVAVSLDLSDAYVDLLADRIDLAVRITAEVPPTLEATRLATSRRVLCAAPAYLAEHGVPPDIASLRRHRLLSAEGSLPWRYTLGAGGSFSSGNSSSRSLNLTVDAVKESEKDKLTLTGRALYSEDTGETTADQVSAGARYDWSERAFDSSLVDKGPSATLTFWPSEFSQIRGQYRHLRYGEGVTAKEFLFQFLFSIGAHGAHTF